MNDMVIEATVQLVPIEAIRPDPENARRVKATKEDDDTLYKSVAEIGVRVPVILRPDPEGGEGRYLIVAGERRWTASKQAGMPVVPAIVRDCDNKVAAVDQVVENAIRTDMHPVDQWRSISKLMAAGYNLAIAGAMMGLSERAASKLVKLASIHPDILKAFTEDPEMPDWDDIGIIAMAPLEVQAEAFKRYEAGNWWQVVQACEITRIPRSRAIFDINTAGVVFIEDLFASPDDESRFATDDVAGFIAAQTKALAALEAESKGRIMVVSDATTIPAGWQRVWGEIPKRWKKDDKRVVAKWVIRQGFNVGGVSEGMIEPKPVKEGASGPAATSAASSDRPSRAEETTPAPREPITKAGQDILALAKREAVKAALTEFAGKHGGLDTMARTLLLAVMARNVSVHSDPTNSWSTESWNDVLPRLVAPDGTWVPVSDFEMKQIMAEVIARIVVFESPKASKNSGAVAEWIGEAFGAENYMPPLDKAEFLDTCNADLLRQAAAHARIEKPAKTAKGLREQLVDHASGWHPAKFGAPGPSPWESDDDEAPDDGASPTPPDFEADE
jgi:ParB family chromosome partitioning protein